MEELLVYVLLVDEEIVTESSYKNRLYELFLKHPEDEMYLYLEWETNLRKAFIYIRTYFEHSVVNHELFGEIFMNRVNEYYRNCSDINKFGNKMYSLWKNLPSNIQEEQPFHILSYADDPLAYGDEKHSRKLYEDVLNYYKE